VHLQNIAIIGAGVAGMSAARVLGAAQVDVRLFDKGRSQGGRLATRRVLAMGENGAEKQWLFDHGAQFVRAREPSLRMLLDGLVASGAAVDWQRARATVRSDPSFIGVPAMSAIARAMANGLKITTQAHVHEVARDGRNWRMLVEKDGRRVWSEPFGAVIVSAPAPQAAALVGAVSLDAASIAERAIMQPCWAAMFAVPASSVAGLMSGAVNDDAAISWIASSTDRHGSLASNETETLIAVHARADWSTARLEDDAATIVADLRGHLSARLGLRLAPCYESAHRWRYALVDRSAPGPYFWDEGLRLGLCGDWLVGPRVEAAWTSGAALARAIMR